jgi:hypothetical protein
VVLKKWTYHLTIAIYGAGAPTDGVASLRRPVLLAAIGGAAALVLVGASALILHLESVYGPFEPQAPGQHATIINDTAEAVTVNASVDGNFKLSPRGRIVIVNPNYGNRTQIISVIGSAGKVCLTVNYDPQAQISAYISQAAAC